MSDESSAELSHLFRQAHLVLPDEAFMMQLLSRIERARRVRLGIQILAMAAAVVIVLLSANFVLTTTASVMRFAAGALPGYADQVVAPIGWSCSMLIGIWVILRSRPARH